jgi:hypothetical protein
MGCAGHRGLQLVEFAVKRIIVQVKAERVCGRAVVDRLANGARQIVVIYENAASGFFG